MGKANNGMCKSAGSPSRSNNPSLLLETEALRAGEEHLRVNSYGEQTAGKPLPGEAGVSTFWRVFGGTILSISALGVITVCNQFNSSLNDLRRDMQAQVEVKGEFVKKAELERQATTIWTGLKEVRTSLNTLEALNERSKVLDLQVERQAKSSGEERKEILSRVEENRKSAQEEHKDMVKKLDDLRKALDDERKEFLRKLEEQRKNLDEERKEIVRKLEEKQKGYDDQHKELHGKLQVMAERLAAVEGRNNVQPPAALKMEPVSK